MCIQIEIDLDSAADRVHQMHGVPHELRLALRSPADSGDDSLIGGAITIRQLSLSLDYGFVCFGWDLVQFAESLRELHATLEGDAEFTNQEGSICIRLHAVDAGRGTIGVDVSLQQNVLSPFTEDWSYPHLRMQGFGTEQSYLPMIANQIDAFLHETAVNLEHPML